MKKNITFKRQQMNKFKIFKVITIACMVVAGMGTFNTLSSANENFNIKETVQYSDDKQSAIIILDTTSVNKEYTIEEVKDPDGQAMDLKELQYSVKANGTYDFTVSYFDSANAKLEATKTVVVDDIDGIKQEKLKASFVSPQPLTTTNTAGDSLQVIFSRDSGGDIDWTNTDQLDWNYNDIQKMEITAVFSSKGSAKDRYIDVDIPDGYSILGYSAKVGTTSQKGESIIETTDAVQQAMESSTLTSQNGGAFGSEVVNGYQVTDGYSYSSAFTEAKPSGKVHYEFNEEADTVILTFLIGIDYKLYNYMDGRVEYSDVLGTTDMGTNSGPLLDELQVIQTSGTETLSESIQAKVKGTLDAMYLHSEGSQDTTYIDDTNYSSEYTPTGGTLWLYSAPRAFTLLADEIVITYTYPEGAEYTGLIGTMAVDAGHMSVSNDTVKRQVTFTYTKMAFQERAYLARPVFRLSGDVYGTEDGKENTAMYQTSMAIKPYGSETYYVESRTWTTKLVAADLPLQISGYSAAVYDYAAHGYTDGYQYFGGFGVVNPGFIDKKDVDLSWSFDQVLGTRIIRLAMPIYATISDITLYTTKHPEGILIPDMTSMDSNQGTGSIIDADKLGLDEDEYITKVEGVINTYTAQAGIGNLAWASIVYGYASYGVLQGSSNGSQTLTIDGVSASALTTPTEMRLIDSYSVGTDPLKSEYYPGDSISVNTSFASNVTNYNRDTRVTDNFIQDPNVYLRVPKGFTLDETKVAFLFAGNDVSNRATLASKYVASDGATIYKYSFNDPYTIMAGPQMKGSSGAYLPIDMFTVHFDLKVASSNQGTAGLQLREVVMIEGKGNFVAYDGLEAYLRNDDFGLTDTGNNLLAPSTTSKIVVVKKPELQVDSGIRIKDSGNDFATYDGSDSTIAGLSRSKNAEVEISYYNNAPNDFDATNIYFPIPKSGEDYGKYFNNKALSDPLNEVDGAPFSWSASISGEINVPGFTTYYATDGAVNSVNNDGNLGWEAFVPATTWKTFSEISNVEDVVFLKFVANNPIPSGDTGSFTFDLKAAMDTPADTINYWRTYTTSQAHGQATQSGVVGSVLAATLSIGEISGQVFYDKNYNGVYDSGDTLYTGSDLTINLSEKDGKVATTTMPIQSDGTFAIAELKEGDYSISVVNINTSYHFAKTTASTDSVIGSNVTANGTNSEARLEGLAIVSGGVETHDRVGVGLITSQSTIYQFEDRVKSDTNMVGKAKIAIGSETMESSGSISHTSFPQETFDVTPTLTLPEGMIHVGWQLFKDRNGTLTKIGDVIQPEAFANATIPVLDKNEILVVEAIVSYPPTINTTDLVKYVGDYANLLDGVSAVDEKGKTITPITGALGNSEVTQSIPTVDGKYTKVGTYEVSYKVKVLISGSSAIAARVVKVNEGPIVHATPQEYMLGDANILAGVTSNPSATWKQAGDVVGAPFIVRTINGPALTIAQRDVISYQISGPSTDFSKAGIYAVTYTAINVDGKTSKTTVEVLIKASSMVSDDSNTLGIDANNFVVENVDAKKVTAAVAKDVNHGNASAYVSNRDNNGVVSGYSDVTTKVSVDEKELKAIQDAGVAGGIFTLTYTVSQDGKQVSKTVKVLVKPLHYSESSDGSLVIDASDFTLIYQEAQKLDVDKATVTGKAVAYQIVKDTLGNITNFNKVDVTPEAGDIMRVKDGPNRGGIYDLLFTANDGMQEVRAKVKVTVLPETGIVYTVEYYLQRGDGNYELVDSKTSTGTVGNEVNAEVKEYEGYTFDVSNPKTMVRGEVAGDGSLVLKLFYTKDATSIKPVEDEKTSQPKSASTNSKVETGDTTNIGLLVSLLGVSILGIIVILKRSKDDQ